jgi:hypothetical protein
MHYQFMPKKGKQPPYGGAIVEKIVERTEHLWKIMPSPDKGCE